MALKLDSQRQIEIHPPESIRLYDNTEAADFPPHWHMSYELIMPVDGVYSATVNDEMIDLAPNDLLIIPSGTVHELIAPEHGRRYFFMMDRERIFSVEGLQTLEHIFYPYCLVRASEDPRAAEHYYLAVREFRGHGLLGHTAAHLELTMMLVEVLRARMPVNPPQSDALSAQQDQRRLLFMDISAHIDNHCTEDLTVEKIAASAGYSRCHFERLFREYIGSSFHDYLIRKRLDLSKRMLLKDDDAITMIAHRAGFSSIATFNRLFRDDEGIPPSEYRRRGRQQ